MSKESELFDKYKGYYELGNKIICVVAVETHIGKSPDIIADVIKMNGYKIRGLTEILSISKLSKYTHISGLEQNSESSNQEPPARPIKRAA